jgi:hypothetical protein
LGQYSDFGATLTGLADGRFDRGQKTTKNHGKHPAGQGFGN